MTYTSSLALSEERVDVDMLGPAHMLHSQRFSLTAGVEQQLRLVGRSAGTAGEVCQMVLAVSVSCSANAGEQRRY